VIVTGGSPTQIQALARSVGDKALEMAHQKPLAVDGMHYSQWVAMDFAEVIVHIMLPEERAFYDIEHLWADARFKGGEGDGVDICIDRMGDSHAVLRGIGGQGDGRAVGVQNTDGHGGLLYVMKFWVIVKCFKFQFIGGLCLCTFLSMSREKYQKSAT
jgi:hypothetical protein